MWSDAVIQREAKYGTYGMFHHHLGLEGTDSNKIKYKSPKWAILRI